MGWNPKVTEADKFPDKMEKGLWYSLRRLVDFQSASQIVQIFDEIKICHGDCLSDPYGQAFKGDDCWGADRQKKYRAENRGNSTPLISAYRDSAYEHSKTLGFSISWVDCEFYIEAVSDAVPIVSECQARLDQMERATLLALLILSTNRISSVRPINYYKQPGMPVNAFMSSGLYINKYHSEDGGPFVLTRENEPVLVSLAHQIYNRKHPEAYLASLRLMRAINRHQVDDSVVDLVIALEALFNGTKDPGITLRVGQRLSHLLRQSKAQRRITTKIVKEAYGMRSNLVHGTRRQIGALEDILGHSGKAKSQPVKDHELREIKSKLLSLISSALLVRYTDHKDLSQSDFFKILDDKAV